MSTVTTVPAWRRGLELCARLLIAGLFAWAAIGKLADPTAFAQSIANYRILPEPLPPVVAVLLPGTELVIAAALVVGVGGRGAAILAAGLLFVFAGAMVTTILRGINLTCGCFGQDSATVSWWTVGRNIALAAVAALPAVAGITPWSAMRKRGAAPAPAVNAAAPADERVSGQP